MAGGFFTTEPPGKFWQARHGQVRVPALRTRGNLVNPLLQGITRTAIKMKQGTEGQLMRGNRVAAEGVLEEETLQEESD